MNDYYRDRGWLDLTYGLGELRSRLAARSVATETGCREWLGADVAKGYGQIRLRRAGNVNWLAHRLAWTVEHGAVPAGMDVCHRCDNPKCINVEHLFVGTRADNMRDMAAKGRSADSRGERSGMAKLTGDQVQQAIARRRAGESIQAIAWALGVHPSHMGRVLSGKRWAVAHA